MPASPRIVNCPRCGAPVKWGPESPFRPFCSERCKMIDLGAWATERYRVPDAGQDSETPDDER
jgi:endogenous inhibitor of DNA gyrase (YacG/DUF329 family)